MSKKFFGVSHELPVIKLDRQASTMTFSKVIRSPFGPRLWLQRPLYRSRCARSVAGASSASSGGIKFVSQQSRLNEDNMSAHHQSTEIPPQEWTMFNDKVAVLQDAVKTDEGKEKLTQTFAGEMPRMSLLMELTDKVGVLHDVLRFFWKYDVNVCRIESRPVEVGPGGQRRFDFFGMWCSDFDMSVTIASS
jgi:hypothetical protein